MEIKRPNQTQSLTAPDRKSLTCVLTLTIIVPQCGCSEQLQAKRLQHVQAMQRHELSLVKKGALFCKFFVRLSQTWSLQCSLVIWNRQHTTHRCSHGQTRLRVVERFSSLVGTTCKGNLKSHSSYCWRIPTEVYISLSLNIYVKICEG